MKNWSRLILPVGLGVIAASINASVLYTRLEPVQLIRVTETVEQGERFTEDSLAMVEVPYPSSHLTDHFFEWKDRHILLNTVGAARTLLADDLVPRVDYRSFGRSPASIGEKQIEVGVRISEAAISVQERRLLVPGGYARLKFDNGLEIKEAMIAYLQPCLDVDPMEEATPYYELGILLRRPENEFDSDALEQIQRLSSAQINQVVGLSQRSLNPY